jgi:hypothetical protein
LEHDPADDSGLRPEGPEEGRGSEGGGLIKLAAAAVGVGLLAVALNVLVDYIGLSSENSSSGLSLTILTGPILQDLLLFLVVFLVAARLRISPLEGGVRMVVSLFLGGAVIGLLGSVIDNFVLVPFLYPYAESGSVASLILTLPFAESLVYDGFEFLFLAVTALAFGYFWSENPLWHPRAWLERETPVDEDASEVPKAQDGEGAPSLS